MLSRPLRHRVSQQPNHTLESTQSNQQRQGRDNNVITLFKTIHLPDGLTHMSTICRIVEELPQTLPPIKPAKARSTNGIGGMLSIQNLRRRMKANASKYACHKSQPPVMNKRLLRERQRTIQQRSIAHHRATRHDICDGNLWRRDPRWMQKLLLNIGCPKII